MRAFLLLMLVLLPALVQAEQQVYVQKVVTGPMVDGDNSDEVWRQAKPVLIDDLVANETIFLSAVYTDEWIYFLVQYPDKAENPLHKPWMWSEEERSYFEGPHREDTFVFKWSMMTQDVNLSVFSDDDYRADVWYWKANRSNLAGYADDKMQVLDSSVGEKSKKLRSFNGKVRYLDRISDEGAAPYREIDAPDEPMPVAIRYQSAQPGGSRADVKAKGRWVSGFWVVEFSRKLQTGHADDIQFSMEKKPLFGVSIFSLYGNNLDVSSPNFYGMGRISEPLRLNFIK